MWTGTHRIDRVARAGWALSVVFLVLLTSVLVSPRGEFALNDDWIHAKVVQRLLQGGTYLGHPYVAATLVAQAYWAAIVCKALGFGFATLRISTLVLAGVGGCFVSLTARRLGVSRRIAALAGMSVFGSPIVLNLSYSFMTDVPFLALTTASAYLFVRGVEREPVSARWILASSAAAGLAFLVRQTGVALWVGFAVVLAVRARRERAWPRGAVLAAVVVPCAAVLGLAARLAAERTSGNSVFEPLAGRVAMSVVDGVRHAPVALCYLGLFVLPLVLPLTRRTLRGAGTSTGDRRLVAAWCALSGIVFVAPRALYELRRAASHRESEWLLRYPVRMPLLGGDYLLDLGIGHDQLPLSSPMVTLGGGWWPWTVAAVLSGGIVVAIALRTVVSAGRSANPSRESPRVFLVVWAGLMIAAAYSPWRVHTFDRYLLPALPPVVLLVCQELEAVGRRGFALAVAGWTFMYAFAVAGLQDYLGWNRAAWAAEERLLREGVPSLVIRGVDAASGWYNSEQYMRLVGSSRWQDSNVLGYGPWVTEDRCVITSGNPGRGYRAVAADVYFSWLGMGSRSIVTYCRCDESTRDCVGDVPVL